MGVGGHFSIQAVGVLNESCQGLRRVLGTPYVAVGGQTAAGGADLDPVHAHGDDGPHGLKDLMGIVSPDPHGVEMPRRRRDRQSAGQDAWSVEASRVDGLLQGQGHAEHVGTVPDGRHPAPQGAAGVVGGLDDGLDGALVRQGGDAVRLHVHDEVYVGIDEAGEQRGRTQVDDFGVARYGKAVAGSDGMDPVAIHQDQTIGDRGFALPAE